MKKGVEGIRICCSGRLEGAEIARTECGKYGKTSRNVFNQKIDYAPAEVSTRYGISGRCSRGCKSDGTQLGFGRYGTKSCRAGRLSYRAIEAARRAIIRHFHRAMSGQFRRNGKIWVRVLADIPITRKPTEVRMGRGKGNPTGWIARVSRGQILFEMDGVSLSNARQAATLAAHKLCSSTKFVQWSVREASGLPIISHSRSRETLITIACQKQGVEVVRPIPRNAPSIGAYGSILVVAGVVYNFGPNGRPSNLSEWGIPVGNNQGPTVGNSRHKQVDRRGPALLLLHRGAVLARSKGCRERVGGGTCWHNARWNVGIRGLWLDPFRSTGRPAPAVYMSIGNLYSSVPLGPDRIDDYRIEFALQETARPIPSACLICVEPGLFRFQPLPRIHRAWRAFCGETCKYSLGGGESTLPYEYSDYNSSDEQSLTFDSYTIPEDDLELGQSRLLEVDNRVVLPTKSHIRFIVTSADVPHSWAVPSLGVKCDVVPGRLNQTSISVQRGVYYGKCSEICGTNHAFMPIVVEVVPRKDYGSRVSNQLIPQTPNKEPVLVASPLESSLSWGGPARKTEMDLNKPPLPDDETCQEELENRLRTLLFTSYMGEELAPVVEKQLEIEKSIFTELMQRGYSLESLVEKRNQIRGCIFSPNGEALSERTYALHLREIRRLGTAQSLCFHRVEKAIKNQDLLL
ncbi:hypothetical protein MTR67_038335 [Solanum verrucosum]|uniref:cytochrome-c oxidase n=1 Tax=Solanum verrucosum TaxID=315347 RepID=A0AAF0UF20_SOLVR|nr:hypothetical protein MTR67_038335 [Solanum verrucosum]